MSLWSINAICCHSWQKDVSFMTNYWKKINDCTNHNCTRCFFMRTFQIYNCTNCDQLHTKINPGCPVWIGHCGADCDIPSQWFTFAVVDARWVVHKVKNGKWVNWGFLVSALNVQTQGAASQLTKHRRFQRSFELSESDARLLKLFRQTVFDSVGSTMAKQQSPNSELVTWSLAACSIVSRSQRKAASGGNQRTFVSWVCPGVKNA